MGKKAKDPKKRTNRPSPLQRMQEAFAMVNLDQDAQISREEFLKAMETVGVPASTADQLFKRFDPDGSGQLDKDEFFAYAAKGCSEIRGLLRRGVLEADEGLDQVVEIFKSWDTDGDGVISKKELERVLVLLNPSFTKKDFDKMFKQVDTSGDGFIDYEELADWLHDSGKKKRK